MSAIIHKFKHSSDNSSSARQLAQLLDKITDCLNEELSDLVGRMFDGADDMLFQLAENADSNEDQANYFETMRMLRMERPQVGNKFATSLKDRLQPVALKPAGQAFDEDELSLVDQSEMEEMVAISAMHSKAMNLYGEAVRHLEARIEHLSLKNTNTFSKDALAPKSLCDAFKDALTDIELSTNNKLILYKLFDQEVILHLETFYQKLNQIFIDEGILPQIKLSSSKTEPRKSHRPAVDSEPVADEAVFRDNPVYNPSYSPSHSHGSLAPGPASSGGAQGTQSGSGSGNIQQEINRVARQFIHGEATATGSNIPSSFSAGSAKQGASTQYYDRRDVMTALSNLQQHAASSHSYDAQIELGALKQALLVDIGAQSGGAITKQVSQVDEKTIDLIEMLFDAIVADDSIPDPVTNLLLRLQIPVIKAAMIDENFFVSSDHPCKTTLNIIAHLGRGIIDRNDELFIQLETVTDEILNDFDIDLDTFESAVEALEIIEQDEFSKTIEKEKETQKTVLHAHAREMVLVELQHHARNKTLPKASQKLLLKHWSTLMFHRYIKFGKSSTEWSESSSAARQLIQLLQPIESSQSYYTLDNDKDEVLDFMHTNLLLTRQNPVEIEAEMNQVFNLIESMLDTSSYNPRNASQQESYFMPVEGEMDFDSMPDPEIELEDEVDPLQEQARIARDKIAQLPSDIRPGAWFKVFNGDDSAARRAKLSVIVMEEAKLVFVDRMGVKVIEKDAGDFYDEIQSEKSSFIADHSAFDHALGMVINSLSGSS